MQYGSSPTNSSHYQSHQSAPIDDRQPNETDSLKAEVAKLELKLSSLTQENQRLHKVNSDLMWVNSIKNDMIGNFSLCSTIAMCGTIFVVHKFSKTEQLQITGFYGTTSVIMLPYLIGITGSVIPSIKYLFTR